MDNRSALLETIKQHPDDDLPRLVYADFIEEYPSYDTDPQRAAFIRAQVALARLPFVKWKAGTIMAKQRLGNGEFAPGLVPYDPNVQGLTAMSVLSNDVPNDDPEIERLRAEIRGPGYSSATLRTGTSLRETISDRRFAGALSIAGSSGGTLATGTTGHAFTAICSASTRCGR